MSAERIIDGGGGQPERDEHRDREDLWVVASVPQRLHLTRIGAVGIAYDVPRPPGQRLLTRSRAFVLAAQHGRRELSVGWARYLSSPGQRAVGVSAR